MFAVCYVESLVDRNFAMIANYLFVYVWLTIQELVGGLLMSASSLGALLEEQWVQLADWPWTPREVIHQLSLMDCHLLWGECLWMKVHCSHGVAFCVGPDCDLSPVTPSVEQEAGLQRGEADEVLVAPGHQFVFLRHVEQMVSIDTDHVSTPFSGQVESNCFWIPIKSSVHRKCRLVAVAIPHRRRKNRQDREPGFTSDRWWGVWLWVAWELRQYPLLLLSLELKLLVIAQPPQRGDRISQPFLPRLIISPESFLVTRSLLYLQRWFPQITQNGLISWKQGTRFPQGVENLAFDKDWPAACNCQSHFNFK